MVVISNYLINHPYELTKHSACVCGKSMSLPSLPSQKISWSLSVRLKRWRSEMWDHYRSWWRRDLYRLYQIKNPKKSSEDLCKQLSESDRILPGGYIYLSDLLKAIQRFWIRISHHCQTFRDKKIDAVMTVATKVPLKCSGQCLECSIVIVRRDLQKGQPLSVLMFQAQVGIALKENVPFKRSPKSRA